MNLLPKWIMQDTSPAVYDTESVTALEGVAKLHAAMQALIKEYNELVENINTQFTQIVTSYGKDQKEHETALRQEFQDFIDVINLKIAYLTGSETPLNPLPGGSGSVDTSELEQQIAELDEMINELREQFENLPDSTTCETHIYTYDSLDAVPDDLPEGSFVAVPSEETSGGGLTVVELETVADVAGATLSDADVAKIEQVGANSFVLKVVCNPGDYQFPMILAMACMDMSVMMPGVRIYSGSLIMGGTEVHAVQLDNTAGAWEASYTMSLLTTEG